VVRSVVWVRIADLMELCSVEIMISGIRVAISLSYSQSEYELVAGLCVL